MKKNLKGFTLVEVLIVIIIVGILIAALLPRLVGTQSRARDTARAGHVNQVAQAAALWSADNESVTTGCVDATYFASGNLSSIPSDPQGTNGAIISAPCTEGEYVLSVHAATNSMIAIADVENTSNGNCTAAVTAGTLLSAALPTITTSGPNYCVIVR